MSNIDYADFNTTSRALSAPLLGTPTSLTLTNRMGLLYTISDYPFKLPTNCKNCGAPLHTVKCEYCSTELYTQLQEEMYD